MTSEDDRRHAEEHSDEEGAVDSTSEASDDLDFGLEQFGEIDDEQGLSLEELSQAYASLIGNGDDPYDAAAKDDSPQPWEFEDEESDQSCDISPHSILEAMLFVGHPENHPLTSRAVAALMRGVRPSEIDEMVKDLNATYAEQRCPYEIRSVGAGYQLVLRTEFALLRDRFYGRVKAAKLSQTVVDVLAIVAYKQPISKAEVEQIRGKSCGGVLNQLVRRQLIGLVQYEPTAEPDEANVDGGTTAQEPTEELSEENQAKASAKKRGKSKRKPVPMYSTTSRFLQVFGLSSLDDLPRSIDIEQLW